MFSLCMLSPVLTLEVCLGPGSSCGVQGMMWTAGSCAPPPLLLLARCSCPPPGNTQARLCSLSSTATSWLQPRLASWVSSSWWVSTWLARLRSRELRLCRTWSWCSCCRITESRHGHRLPCCLTCTTPIARSRASEAPYISMLN